MRYHDKEGKPISHERWTVLSADMSYVYVKLTKMSSGRKTRTVRTIWLGFNPMEALDHYPIPKIFAVTFWRGHHRNGEEWFATTEAGAIEHHDQKVGELAAELDNPTITHSPTPLSPEGQ